MILPDGELERKISRGIWRQKNQETAIKLFVGLIVIPVIFLAIVIYNSPNKCQRKALFCPNAPTAATTQGAPR
jgi:hypothetical protein